MKYLINSTGSIILADAAFVNAVHPGDFTLLPDDPVIDTRPRHVTQYAFLSRFTPTERVAIRTAAKTLIEIEDYMDMLAKARYINLDDPLTLGGLQSLEAATLLTAGRAAEIQSADVTEGERP